MNATDKGLNDLHMVLHANCNLTLILLMTNIIKLTCQALDLCKSEEQKFKIERLDL